MNPGYAISVALGAVSFVLLLAAVSVDLTVRGARGRELSGRIALVSTGFWGLAVAVWLPTAIWLAFTS